MYKLENNVVWTTELKNAFKHNVTRASILYTDDNSNQVELNENNNLVELTLEDERYIQGIGFVGSACARKLNVTLIDNANALNLENKELTLKIGADYNGSTYYINYGNFIVNEPPQIDETTGKVTIVAYDYMIKFNKPYVDRITYPTTLLALLQDICSQAGVTLATTDFASKNFSVTDNQFEGATLREVLMNIAKCAFSWARIGQDNRLYLDFALTSSHTETLTIDDYKTNGFKKSKEYYGPVNRVLYADSNIEGQEKKVEDAQSIQQNGLKELVIYDNLFAYTPEKRQALIASGTRLLGLTYMPVSQLDAIGFIYLDCNDIINIETLDEQTYTSRVFNHIIKYNGVTSDNIVTEGTSTNQEIYRNTATNAFQEQQTKIIVDKANKQIKSIVEEIGDRSQKTTSITQDLDRIESVVSNVVDLEREKSGRGFIHITDGSDVEGSLTYLRITGETILIYPSDTLYPSNTLYPRGQYLTLVIDENNRGNLSENAQLIKLPMLKALKILDEEIYDEIIFDKNTVTQIYRVGLDVNGDKYELPTPEIITTEIGYYSIFKNNTYLYILENANLDLESKYIADTEYTEAFATKVEMNSKITQTAEQIQLYVSSSYETKEDAVVNYSSLTQTAEEISSEVSRKVGKNEVISTINQSPEAVTINANKININGTISANGNFKVDTYGNMICSNANVSGNITSSNATITGGTLGVTDGTRDNPNLYVESSSSKNNILPNSIYIDTNNGGMYINSKSSSNKHAYIYCDSTGGGITLGGSGSDDVVIRARKWSTCNL